MSRSSYHALSVVLLGCLSSVYGVSPASGQARPREEGLRLSLPKAEVAEQEDDERRLLKELYNAALEEWESLWRLAQIGQISAADPQLQDCLQRVVAAGMELHRRGADRIKLLEECARVAKALHEATNAAAAAGRIPEQEQHRSRYYRIRAELLLLRERKGA